MRHCRLGAVTKPTESDLNTILMASPAWPHGPIHSLALGETGQGHGMSGGTVYQGRAYSGGGEVSFIVKRESAEATRRAQLFHEDMGKRVPGVVPACYGASSSGAIGLLLLEDIHGRQGDDLAGCTDGELVAVIRSLVAVHAASWKDDEAAHRADLPRWQASGWDHERWTARLAGARYRYPEVMAPAAIERLADVPSRVDASVVELRRGPAAWIHTDAHLDNVVWRQDGSTVLLDWSGAAIGPPAVDLARLCLQGALGDQPIAERSWLVASTAAAELAGHGITDTDEETVGRWIQLGMQPVLQGIVGWAGRAEDTVADSRMVALRDNAIRNAVSWLAAI